MDNSDKNIREKLLNQDQEMSELKKSINENGEKVFVAEKAPQNNE